MDSIVSSLFVFISTLISIVILGLAAGFSPMLYVSQFTIGSAKPSKRRSYTIALVAGVLAAILLLIGLFQVMQLSTLLSFLDTTIKALVVNVTFSLLLGSALIYGGYRYLKRSEKPNEPTRKPKTTHGIVGIAGLGFFRTFVSVSGVTATYIAANIISNASNSIIERLILTIAFLVATVLPFIGIVWTLQRRPVQMKQFVAFIRTTSKRYNFRRLVGLGAILVGGMIILVNGIAAVFLTV